MKKQRDIFLNAYYSTTPRAGVNTSVAGWMNDTANIQYDEQVEIQRGDKTRSIPPRIVLNLSKKMVVRDGFGNQQDFKEMFKYFFAGYNQYILQIMQRLDPEFLLEVLGELEAEMLADKAQSQLTLEPADQPAN
jgi:hypothetical protein